MKKLFASFTSALAIFAFSLPFGTTVKSAEFFTIGTGGATGVYFQVGNAICKMVAKLQSADHGRKKVKIKPTDVLLHLLEDQHTILVKSKQENFNLV